MRRRPVALNASANFSCTEASTFLKSGCSERACSATVNRARPESFASSFKLALRIASMACCSPSNAVVMNDSGIPLRRPRPPGGSTPHRKRRCKAPSTSLPRLSTEKSSPSREKSRYADPPLLPNRLRTRHTRPGSSSRVSTTSGRASTPQAHNCSAADAAAGSSNAARIACTSVDFPSSFGP